MPTPVQRVFDYLPQAEDMAGASTGTQGVGQVWGVTYAGAVPAPGDTWKLEITQGEFTTIIGGDDYAKLDPTYCFTYHNKVYLISKSRVLFCDIGNPRVFIDDNLFGAGFVDMDNQTAVPENLSAMSTFQGRLAFLARRSVQIWDVAADPANWTFRQALENTGALAKDSVRSTGFVDALYLSDYGIASMKAREVTGNAYVDDLGAAIAGLIREAIKLDANGGVNACAVIEPSLAQYWLFLNNKIYVLSYFPSSKVLAWSTFEARDSVGSLFTPEKFVVFQGQVFVKSGNVVYAYGGADKQTYDATEVIVELPWNDLKTPDTTKLAEWLNAAFIGTWQVFVGMDPKGPLHNVAAIDSEQHTYDDGIFPHQASGTHVKFRLVTRSASAARFSSLVFHYALT